MAPRGDNSLNQALVNLERLKGQIDAYSREAEVLEVGINEHARALSTIEHLATVKKGTEVLIPLGAGSYLFAKSDQVDSVIVSLGSGVRIEEDTAAAKDRLTTRLETIRRRQQGIIQELQRLEVAAENLSAQIQALSQAPPSPGPAAARSKPRT